MKGVHGFPSVLKVVGMIVALIGLLPAIPGVVQADIQPAPAGILNAALYNTCALTPGGAVDCWGWDGYGQAVDQRGPYTQVSAGYLHTCALTPGGAADCWGVNPPYFDFGQAADQAGPYTQVGAGYLHTCALTPDGAADCWGADNPDFNYGQAVDQAGPYVQLSVGLDHTCALTPAGQVECWGSNASGQADYQAGPYTQTSAGYLHTCALTPSGAVDCWGVNDPDFDFGQAADRPGPYAQVRAGVYHTCALTPDGAVDCWGKDTYGQVSGVGGNISGFATHPGPYTQVSAGYHHTCALTPDGAVDCWGNNTYGAATDQAGPYGPFTPSPTVTRQPQNLTVATGHTASFNAAGTGWPDPTLQWQVSTDGGNTWTDIAGATASPLAFTASLDQDGTQYRAVFANIEGSATSNAATLNVTKRTAAVILSGLSQMYDGQPKAATITTDPAGLTVNVTYADSTAAPTAAGSHTVVATINDATYEGTTSGTLTIAPKEASVTPDAASKVYGGPDPALSGTLAGFVEADGVTAAYNRAAGEAVGDYLISASLSPADVLANYTISYNSAAFSITPRPVTVTADAKTKDAGELDPPLTYQITGGSLAFSDAFSGELARDLGEEAGIYAIRQGTLALSSNYTLIYVGADLTILAASLNTAPVANPGGPYLGAINTAIAFDGSASSDPDGDALTYAWTFGDGGTATGVMPAHSYAAAGIYDVCLTVNDGTVDSPQACTMAVVYDPSAGFVTGGGSINSPAGAYKPDPSLRGPATFGFISKYKKGQSVPTGNTAFQFDAAGFSFYSEIYEWLVVNQGGTNAQFKGSGTVNGGLDPNGNLYKFMIWAADGSPDTLRIRIWWEADGVETDVYDNGGEQAIGAGNIVVHASNK